MLQKILCGYTTPISKFKSNPNAALAEAQGDAIVVSNNQIQFYTLLASLFEEMTAFCEFAQRGTTTLEIIPAQFTTANLNMDKVSSQMANKLKQDAKGKLEEWK